MNLSARTLVSPASSDLLVRRTWQARMIAPAADQGAGGPSCYVAKTFQVTNPAHAVLHISAQGLYRAFINGQRVGDDELTPGWTNYDSRIDYQSYDVSDLLRPGENRIEIWLGDGWYRSQMMWRDMMVYNCWGKTMAAIAEIETERDVLLASDGSWVSGLLPVTKSGIYYGEDHDARIKPEATHGVTVLGTAHELLVAAECAPVKSLQAIEPVESWADADGTTIYDFGQNVAGYCTIEVSGEAGAEIYIDHAEVLGPNREFDRRNYREARAALKYTLSGDGAESWAPTFTFMGYRYARVKITGNARLASIRSVPVTSVPEPAGAFTCGDPLVNRLVLNTLWSQRGNFIEVPTDCPQRDERMGWTGDAQVFAGTACWLADCRQFLTKYMRDVVHDQRDNGAISYFSPDPTRMHPHKAKGIWAGSTGWGDVVTVIPWQLYLHYGDKTILEESFPAMLRWLDYMWSISDGPIIHPSSTWGGEGFSFGDWLQPIGDNRKPRPTIADDCAATLYHFISTDLTAKIARILGKGTDAERLETRREEIRAAFVAEYFTSTGRLAHNDQTSYALAFLYDLVPDRHWNAAKTYFRRVIEDANYRIGTGFIGTPALLPALSKLGMNDLAEKVFLNREVPGWLYQVEQGATTIWERWDAIGRDGTIYEPSMNSYNHYAYGAVCQWLFENVAGVQPTPEAPGFDRVRVSPAILPALGEVHMWHDCRHGRIEVDWQVKGNEALYTITLPSGCEGVLAQDAAMLGLTLNGDKKDVPAEGLHLPAGRNEIVFGL